MKTDPLVKLLVSAYRRGKTILAEREKVTQQPTPTETKIAVATGDSGTRNTDNGNLSASYHERNS